MLTKATLASLAAALVAAAPTADPLPKLLGRNLGYSPLPDGSVDGIAFLKTLNGALTKYGADRLSIGSDRLASLFGRSTVEEKLSDQNEQGEDVEYYGNVQIGSASPQTFTVDFDTGSADLFVPGPSCGTSQGCVGSTKYSRQGTDEHNTTSITYGSGQVTGENYFDTVCVAGLCTTHTNVISLTTAEGFSSSASEGLMGMGFSTIANSKQPTFFENLIASKKVTTNEFGFYLGRAASNTQGNSELTLGGADSSRYTGTPQAHKVTQKGYWQIALGSVSVSGKNVAGTGGQAAIDTGTTIILAPTTAATAIFAQIPGAFPVPLASGSATTTIFAYPCNTKALPQLVFDGKAYSINPLDFNLGKVDFSLTDLFGSGALQAFKDFLTGEATCLAALAGADLSPTENLYVVGDTFLKNWYSIYNYDNGASVSFAKAV